MICVPGGVGTDDMVNDEEMLDFLRRQAAGAKYITSVCTGSLVLGAAGLLQRLPRGDALDGDGFLWRLRRDRRPRPASASTATASPAAASPRASISR